MATRRLRSLLVAISMCTLVVTGSARAQGAPQTQAPPAPAVTPDPAAAAPPNEEDPTRAVFFSIRNEFTNLRGDAWANATIFRSDRVVLRPRSRLGGKVGVLTRFDLPVVTMGTGDATRFGLGDLYMQALYVPWLTRGFAMAMGSGFNIPTATQATLGTGKWQAAPVFVPIWFFRRQKGFFDVRVQQHLSFAGDGDRRDINTTEIVPLMIWNFKRRWWTTLDTTAVIDWNNERRTSYRSSVHLGHVLNRRWGVEVKPEIFWGAYRQGDWKLSILATRYKVKVGGPARKATPVSSDQP